MKKTGFAFIVMCSILFVMAACSNIHINGMGLVKGNGVFAEKERGVMTFHAVDTKGAIDVIIADIAEAPVKVSGDENLIDNIETEVRKVIVAGTYGLHLIKTQGERCIHPYRKMLKNKCRQKITSKIVREANSIQ